MTPGKSFWNRKKAEGRARTCSSFPYYYYFTIFIDYFMEGTFEHPSRIRAASVPATPTRNTHFGTRLILPCNHAMMHAHLGGYMSDTKICVVCHEEKHWRRFRPRNNDGTYRESDTCSTCRSKAANRITSKRSNRKKKAVLNRTKHDEILAQGGVFTYPKIEKAIRTYCNKQTAMDRKYLRDVQEMPPVHGEYLTRKRKVAIAHAHGWVGFYEDICKHSISLLRKTGTRPPFAQMEESADLQKFHGIYNTKRARRLRGA